MFHGYSLEGRNIKVERIRSHGPRVRVPERLLAYTLGEVKRVREGKPNTLRRISKDDVERLSRGQPAKRRGSGSRQVPHRLSEEDRAAFDRAARNGFVTLSTGGGRYHPRLLSPSSLRNIHRQWCDARAKPQIMLFKAVGRRQIVDSVLIDLSPLRCIDDDVLMDKFKADIYRAANLSGMMLVSTGYSTKNDDDEVLSPSDDEGYSTTTDESTEIIVNSSSWETEPIWRLPVVSVGIFEGDRAKAKEMAKRLSLLWEISEDILSSATIQEEEYPVKTAVSRIRSKGSGKTKVKGLSSHRERSRQERY